MIDLKAIRERDRIWGDRAYQGLKVRDMRPTNAGQGAYDRAQLLALVDRMSALLARTCQYAHEVDELEEMACVDDCAACDAEELLLELDGDGGGR